MDRSTSESPSLPGSPNPISVSTPVKSRYPAFHDSQLALANGDSAPSTPGTVTPSGTNVGRKESYKMQRKNYRFEKKKAAKELLSTLKDPSAIVLADWLKVRGTLKSWTKLWCVLKPGLLLLYKSDKVKDWVGTILLSMCKLIERPSKKDGFCFKLYHPLDQSIWAPKGPQGETIPAPVQPLPNSHLIFRVSSLSDGKCWMDALELALKCSSLLIRSMSTRSSNTRANSGSEGSNPALGGNVTSPLACKEQETTSTTGLHWHESDFEKHFKDHECDDTSHTDDNDMVEMECRSRWGAARGDVYRQSESDSEEDVLHPLGSDFELPLETNYAEEQEEEFGSTGEQIEELADDNKSLIWFLVKQVRPGMDLSKVVLPTFILEPRSFLDKLSDYYYHADILSRAVLEDDPYTRMKSVVQWYLSGFYKKPKGLRKPYNPILGEMFRCCWRHPSGSTTYYIAEQVSHHPPISALYVTNRKDGFTVSATILAKSKFYGNSLSALLEGSACLSLLPRGEDYIITMPYAHCKGILVGTLTMELGGQVFLKCDKTGYRADLEFKLKPMLGGSDLINHVTGKLRLGNETLSTISGRWDDCITIEDKKTGDKQVLWHPTPAVRSQRLKRSIVPLTEQMDFESEKMWQRVSAAIRQENQELATSEKTVLEEAQRTATRSRMSRDETWAARSFELEPVSGSWQYRHADVRPWDLRNDVIQYEKDFIILTKTRHRTPMIRAASIASVERQLAASVSASGVSEGRKRLPRSDRPETELVHRRMSRALHEPNALRQSGDGSISSSAEGDHMHSSEEDDERLTAAGDRGCPIGWTKVMEHLDETRRETQEKLTKIHNTLQSLIMQQQQHHQSFQKANRLASRDLYLVALVLALCQIVVILYWKK